jgi:hypothetical protein
MKRERRGADGGGEATGFGRGASGCRRLRASLEPAGRAKQGGADATPPRTCIYCGALTFKGVAARAATLATLASHACASGKSPLLLQPPPK